MLINYYVNVLLSNIIFSVFLLFSVCSYVVVTAVFKIICRFITAEVLRLRCLSYL